MTTAGPNTDRLRIAYVSAFDPLDIRQRSGAPFMIARRMEEVADVEYVAPLSTPLVRVARQRERFHRHVLGTVFQGQRDPRVCRAWARKAARRLAGSEARVVFGPDVAPLAYLDCSQPIVFWNDATFANLADYYHSYSNLSRATRRDGMRQAQLALERCALAVYTTEWAARSALQDFGADPAKVMVIAHGAVLPTWPARDEVAAYLAQRLAHRAPRLLLVGVDWRRKGADIAVAATGLVREAGVPATLDIVGCLPPARVRLPSYVTATAFVSKDTAAGRRRLHELRSDATLNVLPTRAECMAISLLEAGAYGLPSVTTRTGGVVDAVLDGVTGVLLSPEAGAEEYASAIAALLGDPDIYRRQSLAARRRAEDEFDNDVLTDRVIRAMATVVARADGEPSVRRAAADRTTPARGRE